MQTPQQGDKRDPFGLLGPKPKKPRADDPFGLLAPAPEQPDSASAASTGARPDSGDVDLRTAPVRPSAVKPGVGRGIGEMIGGLFQRADASLAGDAYQSNVIPRIADRPRGPAPVPHRIATVTTTAAPERVKRHVDHLDPVTQVLANTQAGIGPATYEWHFDEQTFNEVKKRLTDRYNDGTAPEDDRKWALRTLGQLEKQRSEALALREESFGEAVAHGASLGVVQPRERYAIERAHRQDIQTGRAVTPEELHERGILREDETATHLEPGERGAQSAGKLLGSVVPFEVGERATAGVLRGAGKMIRKTGIRGAETIGKALEFAHAPGSAETDIGSAIEETAKGALRGQGGMAAMGAGEAALQGESVSDRVKAGIVPAALMGVGFHFAAPIVSSRLRDALDITGKEYSPYQTGAHIAEATHMIDATRPDRTPIGDKMPEAQGKAIGAALQAVLEQKRAADAATVLPPEVERREAPRVGAEERRVWTPEERTTYIAEQQRKFVVERGNKLWSAWTPEEKAEYFAEQERLKTEAPWRQQPEEAPSLTDNFDMSKNLERITAERAEEAALQEQARVAQEAEASGEEQPPRTPQERLARAKAAYEANVPEPVREAIPKIAFAGAAVAGASQTEDETKRAALLGAAALGLNRVEAGELRARFNRGETPEVLARDYNLSPDEVRQIAEVKPTQKEIETRVKAGESLRDIAREYGTQPNALKEIRRSGDRGREFDTENADRDEEIARRFRGGASARTLADEFKITKGDVRRIAKRLSPYLLPAAAVTAASQVEDEKKRGLLLGGAMLTTGAHEGEIFHSRLVKAIDALPAAWNSARPAADWLGKLSAGGAFAKGEFDITLKDFLETAKAEKRKLTKAEVLEHAEMHRPRLDVERRTPGGKDLESPAKEPPPEPPPRRRRQVLRAEDIQDAVRGEGQNTLRVRANREEAIRDAQASYEAAESDLTYRRNELDNAAESAGIPRATLERILERHDNGEGVVRVDRAMDALHEYIDEPPGRSEPELNASWETKKLDDGSWVIHRDYDETVIRGRGATKLEAMADFANRYGTESLGNLREILGAESDYHVEERPGEDEPWVMVDRDGDEITSAPTRNDLVEGWVGDRYDGSEIENSAGDEVRDALERYASAQSEYNDVESQTYPLREGEDDTEQFESDLEEAKQEDEQALQDEADATGFAGYDLDFYRLNEEDRDFVREGIAQGAVGTRKPLLGEDYDEIASRELVTDPSEPHVPFPQEGSLPIKHEQLPLHEPISFPPRQPSILRASGGKSAKFTGSQATPGGKNYRELTMSWGNPPRSEIPKEFKYTVLEENGVFYPVDPNGNVHRYEGYRDRATTERVASQYSTDMYSQQGGGGWRDYTDDHWAGDPPNTAVHTRFDEHTYTGGAKPHPEVQKLLDERNALGKRQTDIAAKLQQLVDQVGDNPENATPEMHSLAQEYRYQQEKINELDKRYAAAVDAGYGPGTYKEIATNLIEAQSDWYQVGEVGGYMENKPLPEARKKEIKDRIDALTAERERLNKEEAEFKRQLSESPERKRVHELAQKNSNYTITDEERKEWNRLHDEHARRLQEYHTPYFKRINEIETEQQALSGELRNKRLLPGEKERLETAKKKAKDKFEAAKQAYRDNSSPETRRAMEVAERRLNRYTYAQPVPDTPWRDAQSVFGLAAAGLLKEAVEANSDLATWSHSTNRMSSNTANLPKAAAELTYDDALVNGTKKLLKGLGFDVKPEVIEMDGYKHWSIRLTPEMKAKIKKSSFPILAALALLGMPEQAKAADGSDDDRPSVIPYLIGAGLAAGVWKSIPREMRAKLAARAKAGGFDKERMAELRPKPPISRAIDALKRSPGAVAAAAAAVAISDNEDKDIANTSTPLAVLAVLSAVGTKNLAAARDAVGKAMIEQLRKTQGGAETARFFNPDAMLSPEVREAILNYEKTRSKGRARAKELSAKAEKLGPQGDRAISDVIENENIEDTSNMKPEDVEAVLTTAAQIAKEFEGLTEQKVKLGVIKKHEAIPNYLPRKYAYWEALDVMAENPRPGANRPGQRPRIVGSKRRTIEKGDIESRTKLGEIREASYRTATGIEAGYADVAAAELFKLLRQQPGVIHPEYQAAIDDFLTAKQMMRDAKTANNKADMTAAESLMDKATLDMKRVSDRFRLKGGDYVTLPGSRGFGVLRDAVVQRDVANSLNGIPETRRIDKLIRFWKQSKTVFNPGTHVANILSNTVMSHMGGMRMTEQPIWLVKASRDMKNYGPATRALAEAGVLDLNAVTAGSQGMGEVARSAKSERGLQKLRGTTRPETADVLSDMQITDPKKDNFPTFRKFGDNARALYNNEDNIFRVAMYLKATAPRDPLNLLEASGMGGGPEWAVKHVQGTFGNFRTRSPALRVLRGSFAPFILYSAKAVPAFAKQIVDHPIRYMSLIAAWGALDQYAKSEVGDVPETDMEERDRRKYGYFFPGFVQLPFKNKRGDKAVEDLSRWTPMSGVTDVSQPGVTASAFSPRWPRILTPSGPATDIYSKFYGNIDTYTGDRRYSAEKPLKRNIGQALEDVGDLALPSALSFHRRRLLEDLANNDFDALRTDLPGLAGLRPRYIRPGAVAMNAGFTMQKALEDAKAEAGRAIAKSHSREQDEKILRRYFEYVDQIQSNFERRVQPDREP